MSDIYKKQWALIAHSAIDGPCSGIMAASPDIIGVIEAEEIDTLCIFLDRLTYMPGLYLWEGTMEQATDGADGEWTRIAHDDMQRFLEINGEDTE